MNIGIIGAGISGLTAAYKLINKGHSVTIYDRREAAGGLLSVTNVGAREIELFYHHIFTSDEHIIKLASELGIETRLKWYEPQNAIYTNGKLYDFTSPGDLLKFKEIGLFNRIRMGNAILKAMKTEYSEELDNITAKDWLVKNTGEESYKKVWRPLLKSKYDKDADKISAAWIYNKFRLRAMSRDTLSKEKLGYMSGSFITIIKTIEKKLSASGAILNYSTDVTSVKKDEDGKFIINENEIVNYDKVIAACAPMNLTEVGKCLTPEYIDKLESIQFKANICVMLRLTNSLSPYYWTTVTDSDIPFVLIAEHTNLTGTGLYDGNHIVYLSRYIDNSDPFYSMDDSDIAEQFIKGIKSMFPEFSVDDVIEMSISFSDNAQPVIKKGYGKKVPKLETPIDGLYLCSMANIFPEDRGINYAVKIAEDVVKLIEE